MPTSKKLAAAVLGAAAIGASALGLSVSSASSGGNSAGQDTAAAYATTTPIKHVVVLFDENISFDHYFGTYPTALNPPGEPAFKAAPDTPAVNGLNTSLLTANPNVDEPQRLDPSQADTCDQNHGYSAEQSAYDGGLMDKFVQDTTGGPGNCKQATFPNQGDYGPNGIVMDYFDGNTVTGLWNYAQHYTLNDNSYSTQFGPSTPGAINLVSGKTAGATAPNGTSGAIANGTDIGDQDPTYDQCSNSSSGTGPTITMTGTNVGDLLNRKSISWGWFQGGFTPSGTNSANGFAKCATSHDNIANSPSADYSPHHEPFQYYASTANIDHVSPSSESNVGVSDPANTPAAQEVNHQYNLSWFNQTLTSANDNMPAVSYLKAPEYEDGHAGYSDPIDEQRFLVNEINQIEESKYWPSTAIVIAYDDSDGWYDHQMGPIIRQSQDTADTLDGPGKCGSGATAPAQNDRCGVGPRQPLLVISPWAKQNYVDSTFTDQSSILRFVEDNWSLGRIGNGSADSAAGTLANAFDFNQSKGSAPAIILNPDTGEIEKEISSSGKVTTPSSTDQGSSSDQGGSNGSGGYNGQGNGNWGVGDSGSYSSHGGSPSSKGAGQAGSSSIKLPAVLCTPSAKSHSIVYTCRLTGGSNVSTMVRARLFKGRALVSNVASRVRSHKVKLTLSLDRRSRSGRYTIRLSVDAGGHVGAYTQQVRIR